MNKVIIVALLLIILLGCTSSVTTKRTDSSVSSTEKTAQKSPLKFTVLAKEGKYTATLVNTYPQSKIFTFKQTCAPCRFTLPNKVAVEKNVTFPLDVSKGSNSQELNVYDENNNFYAGATFT